MKSGIQLALAILVVCLCSDAISRGGRITERLNPHEKDIDTLEIVCDSEEYAVLSAFIKSALNPKAYWTSYTCVEIFRSCGGFGANSANSTRKRIMRVDTLLPFDVAQDYGEKNARKWRWDSRFNIVGCEYRWYDFGHPAEDTCESGFEFSRVGIDSAKTQAVFEYASHFMGHLTGASWVFMERRDGVWRLKSIRPYLHF